MDRDWVDRLRDEMTTVADRSAPPAGFPRLPDIPAGRYTDDDFFALEKERIWSKSWVLAAHEDELVGPGQYASFDRLGPPLLLIRGRDERVRAFYNTCQHRGAPLVRDAGGCVQRLVCKYHGWTYELDGELVGVPDAHDFVDLDRSTRGLVEVRCERFGGWWFVSLGCDGPSLLEFLGPVAREMTQFSPERLRLIDRHSMTIDCNWKVAIDAFLEVYHLRHIHPHSVNNLLDHSRTAIGLLPEGHSRMVSGKRDPAGDMGLADAGIEPIPTLTEIPQIANLSYFVFPNLITPTDVAGFPFLQFWPLDRKTTRFDVSWFVADWGEGEVPGYWTEFIKIFDAVLKEDTENVPWIQRSMESPACEGIPLNYQERRIYHFHEQIDRSIGVADVPESLRVPQLMDAWTER
jgi:phenylpropionate dioxygenase-like ring-hydroxylating dioxygenase large terminal subunit